MGALGFEELQLHQAPELASIHAESFGSQAWSIDQIRGSLMLKVNKGWSARIDGVTAGFILCQYVEECGEVLTFCVRPAMRRQSVGRGLVRRAIEQLDGKGKILLEVAADNLAARKLYAGCGFAEISVRKKYYRRGTDFVDALICEYNLA